MSEILKGTNYFVDESTELSTEKQDGLTPETAFKTVKQAWDAAFANIDPDQEPKVFVVPGAYYDENGNSSSLIEL